VSEGNPGSLDALVRLHQYLIRNPGPGETCQALREGCREQPCEWVTTWNSDPYRETITEVDGRAAPHGKDIADEHVGCNGQQQANGVRVRPSCGNSRTAR
jgi:hypothetical protein